MHRFRIEFADGGVTINHAADMQRAISSATMDRHWIAFQTGNKVCVEVVKAERMEDK